MALWPTCWRPMPKPICSVIGWDPILIWAAETFGAPLVVTQGILPADQPEASLKAYGAVVASFAPFSLTALHDLVTLSGSLVLALAVAQGRIAPEQGWLLSRIDELWQIEQWGDDDEARDFAAQKQEAFLHAARFLELSGEA